MIKYSPADMQQFPVVGQRAKNAMTRVQQVVEQLKGRDGSPVDSAELPGQVSFREDCCSFETHGGQLKVTSMFNPPENFVTTDVKACLSNGKLAVPLEGAEQYAGFKGLGGDMTFDPITGSVQKAEVVGYELFSDGAYGGIFTYKSEETKRGQLLTVDQGGFLSQVLLNADGTIAQFAEGSPNWKDKLTNFLGIS